MQRRGTWISSAKSNFCLPCSGWKRFGTRPPNFMPLQDRANTNYERVEENIAVCYHAVLFPSFCLKNLKSAAVAPSCALVRWSEAKCLRWRSHLGMRMFFQETATSLIRPFADRDWLRLTKVKRAVCVGCNYPSKPYGLAGCVLPAVCSSMSYEWTIQECFDVPQVRRHSMPPWPGEWCLFDCWVFGGTPWFQQGERNRLSMGRI